MYGDAQNDGKTTPAVAPDISARRRYFLLARATSASTSTEKRAMTPQRTHDRGRIDATASLTATRRGGRRVDAASLLHSWNAGKSGDCVKRGRRRSNAGGLGSMPVCHGAAAAVASRGENSGLRLEKKRGTAVPRLERAQRVNEQRPCGFLFFMGKTRAASLLFTAG